MSAVVTLPVAIASSRVLPSVWADGATVRCSPIASAATLIADRRTPRRAEESEECEPVVTYAFYRKHTESLLRRYLYASMQVGRSPALLEQSIGRGWVSSRKVRTFEDAVIFVLDIERCLERLSSEDRSLISRIVLQEYTQAETAEMLGMSVRTVCTRFPQALDRLTKRLLEMEILVLPD